jgi:putative flippase GtrA
MRKFAWRIIDFFYPPFARWFSIHTFRYMALGSITSVTGIVVFYLAYNFIFHQEDIQLNINYLPKIITAETAALIVETPITFTVGFLVNKYLVFTHSNLKSRIQLFRYGSVVATNFLLNLALIKIMVEGFGFYGSIAKTITTFLLIIFSYFSQKHFSFGVKKEV